jgi:predicted transcriptional regulator
MKNFQQFLGELRDGCSSDEPCDRCYGVGSELSRQSIGRRLEKLREGAGLAQQDIAEKMEVSIALVNEMEKGRRRVSYKRLESYFLAVLKF